MLCLIVRDLYIIQSGRTGAFKVGRTGDVQRRVRQLQVGNPYPLRVLVCIPGWGDREREVHKRLEGHETHMGRTEWFSEESMGLLPDEVYERIPMEVLEDVDWWKA